MGDCKLLFKALSDPTRMKIVMLLKDNELCVTDICSHFTMSQPSISHHLGILRNAGIVIDRKDGKEIYYSLNTCCILDTCCSFIGNFQRPDESGPSCAE